MSPSSGPERQFPGKPVFSLFNFSLPGATVRDRLGACLGALAGIALSALISDLAVGQSVSVPLLVAPMGASAVLLFAVPASPLAQPWSIVGGNVISALIGIGVTHWVQTPVLVVGLAVSLAIAAMSMTRSLHPPGGAAALLTALIGVTNGPLPYKFALVPVGLNSVLLVATGWLFHRISGHSYPHRPAHMPKNTHYTLDLPPEMRVGFAAQDVDAALAELGETLDIDRDDIDQLLRKVELNALARAHPEMTCADIMSRDVITTRPDTGVRSAQRVLLEHNIKSLPVIDDDERLVGVVGLRELMTEGAHVGDVMIPAPVAAETESALAQLEALTDASIRAIVIVDEDRKVKGFITQTDLLAALARLPALRLPAPASP